MKVAATQNAEGAAGATPAARAATADPVAFQAALAKASTDVKLRPGEAMTPVPGHRYAEITKGARDGMFVNTSGNSRHGEAFVLVRRNGNEYHVYGSGKDRLVVGLHKPKGNDAAAAPEGEKTKPVEGRSRYVEIVSGEREGMYLNTSGNARDGEAFVLSVKDGVERHIYGSGDARVVVSNEVGEKAQAPKDEKTEPVKGRKRYEEIVSGEREGMYLNTSGNARDGKAFVRVLDEDVEYHIYESGKDRFIVANDLLDGDKPGIELRRGERIKRVEGRTGYAEIVSGAREGMFINTSGNARHGEVFVRSVKDGVEQHIYGSGEDRVVISSAKK